MEDCDLQTPPERVTSDSYPNNISAYNTIPVGDGRHTNKAPPNDALRTTLVESGILNVTSVTH